MAAANFLEVLKTFPKTDVSESVSLALNVIELVLIITCQNEEKIRYAKWKAADIAKAFREGRKPTPGPPGWAEEQEELKYLLQDEEQQIPSPPKSIPTDPSGSILISNPSHHISSSAATFPSPPETEGRLHPVWSVSDGPPESWSTAATPGTEEPEVYTIGTPTPSTAGYDDNSQTIGLIKYNSKPRSGSGSSSNTVDSNRERSFQSNPWTNEEHTPPTSPPRTSLKSASPDSGKRVHFTTGSPPPLPPPPLSGSSSPKEYVGPSSIYASPQLPISPSVNYPTQPSPTQPPATSAHILPPPASPPKNYIYSPPPPSQTLPTRHPSPPVPRAPVAEVELTPGLIAKAQKHCRFAISSLDYEDAEQARKELRAALALLGG